MNREILFRGKQVDDGQWVYGYYQNIDNKINGYYGAWIATGNGHEKFKIHPETVGQFTGLLDKNGNRIFEGDVVEFSTNFNVYDARGNKLKKFRSPVVWQDFRAAWAVQMTTLVNNDLYNYVRNNGNAIVIGNIHDNPELINQ